jgi:hypothetical protein
MSTIRPLDAGHLAIRALRHSERDRPVDAVQHGCPPVRQGGRCANAATAKTFAPWLDGANYKPAPGGDFEAGSASWTLSGGAKIVDGNASQQVGGAGDDSSLALPPGASATSPASCVGLAEPTLRMFATGPVTGLVLVQAVYPSGLAVPAGVATGGPWSPTLPMLTGLGLLGKQFSIRVTNIGVGTMRVDDVYIDPYRRG